MKVWCTRPGQGPYPATVLSWVQSLALILPDGEDLRMLVSFKQVSYCPQGNFFYNPCVLDPLPGCSCPVMITLNSLPVHVLAPVGWASYGLNLYRTLNLTESPGLRIIMILLPLLLYVISLVAVL